MAAEREPENASRRAADRLFGAAGSSLPERIVEEAERVAAVPVALYLFELGGRHLVRLAGTDALPERLEMARVVGPEIGQSRGRELCDRIEARLPHAHAVPLWRYGRAIAVLVALGEPRGSLAALAHEATAAIELAERYTDRFATARRARRMTPAAELQDGLLPPRLAVFERAQLAGGILPSYDVGGDWFDYAENSGETRFSVADAAGHGPQAAVHSALALSALRSARRAGDDLEATARATHQAIFDLDAPMAFVTGIIGRFEPRSATLEWVNCGHPAPLLVDPDGSVTELRGPPQLPLGLLFERERRFQAERRGLEAGQRLVLYSDGVTERRLDDGSFFGRPGVEAAIAEVSDSSAAVTASVLLAAVERASAAPLRDDATVLVLAVTR